MTNHHARRAMALAALMAGLSACVPPRPAERPPLVIIDEYSTAVVDVRPPQILSVRMRIEQTVPPVAQRCADMGGILQDDGDDGATCVDVDY